MQSQAGQTQSPSSPVSSSLMQVHSQFWQSFVLHRQPFFTNLTNSAKVKPCCLTDLNKEHSQHIIFNRNNKPMTIVLPCIGQLLVFVCIHRWRWGALPLFIFDFKGYWGPPGHLVMLNASSFEIVWRIFAKFDENGLVNRSLKCHKFWDRVKCTAHWAGPCCMHRRYGGTYRLPHSDIFRKYSIFWLSRPLNCRKQWSKKQKIWHHFHALYGQQIYSHI